jgi:hypothetical protein
MPLRLSLFFPCYKYILHRILFLSEPFELMRPLRANQRLSALGMRPP